MKKAIGRTTPAMRKALTAAFLFGPLRLRPEGYFKSTDPKCIECPEIDIDTVRKLLARGWLKPHGRDSVKLTIEGGEAERELYAKYKGT